MAKRSRSQRTGVLDRRSKFIGGGLVWCGGVGVVEGLVWLVFTIAAP